MGKKNKAASNGRIRIVPLDEMMLVVERLKEVSGPGVDPVKRAAVITWAAQYQGSYYYTRNRALRRMFPKATEVVLFHGVPQSASGRRILAGMGDENAADQPQADQVQHQQ